MTKEACRFALKGKEMMRMNKLEKIRHLNTAKKLIARPKTPNL